jgi:hypothetical protein
MDYYQKIIASLRISYNREKAAQRDQTEKEFWKVTLRHQFLSLFKQEGKTVLPKCGKRATGFSHVDELPLACRRYKTVDISLPNC